MILFMYFYSGIIQANFSYIHKFYEFDNLKSGSKGERSAWLIFGVSFRSRTLESQTMREPPGRHSRSRLSLIANPLSPTMKQKIETTPQDHEIYKHDLVLILFDWKVNFRIINTRIKSISVYYLYHVYSHSKRTILGVPGQFYIE